MSRVKLFSLFLCLLLLAGLCSCAKEPSPNTQNTFTDALGRNVVLPEHPTRVCALLGSFADVWTLSGGTLCAATEDAADYGIDTATLISVGGAHSPSAEAVLKSDCTLVLASASTKSHVALLDTLTSAGICVLYFDVDSFDDYLKMLAVCCEMTGREDLYRQNGLLLKEEIDAVKKEVAASLPEEEKSVLLLRASAGMLKAKGSEGTVLGELLCDLGLDNLAESEASLLDNLSVEVVLKNEPYRIFIAVMGDEKAARESILSLLSPDGAWGQLAAVKEGRVHIMEKRLFHAKPNDDYLTSYEKIAEILLG